MVNRIVIAIRLANGLLRPNPAEMNRQRHLQGCETIVKNTGMV